MYRRDRLYTLDKDRLQNLHDSLKNVRILDEAAYFNSAPENSSPTKGRNRDGIPPAHKGGGKGDRGGNPGAGPSGGGLGMGGYGKGGGSHMHAPGEKGGSANAKGSEYSSHNRNNNRQNAGMSAMAQAMQDAMNGGGHSDIRVITGLADITDKRSNSNKGKSKASPVKTGSSHNVTP